MKKMKRQKPLFDRPDVTEAFARLFLSGFDYEFTSWKDLVTREDDSLLSHTSSPEFLEAYWLQESFSKVPVNIPEIDRAKEALTRFRSAEDLCAQANARLAGGLQSFRISEGERRVLARARRLLAGLLSGITREEVMQRARWGPGASTGLPRRRASAQHKWQLASHITHAALPWFLAFARYGRLPSPRVHVVGGNKVTLVPKSAKTDRVIAIEPDWNMFFQLGLGSAIRCRLQRRGLLLATAQERNQRLAREGSATGRLATLDLKSASDGVSLGLCYLLLPDHVLTMVRELRSQVGDVDGAPLLYEKVSSMGNGFTFELETALFWSIAQAVVGSDGVVSVYGDDIIVPVDRYSEVVHLLEVCGFVVNPKKSFASGPFRESCGGHYFEGADVTPPYFRRLIRDLPSYISAANSLRRRVSLHSSTLALRLAPASRLLRDAIPRCFWGPASEGDAVLASSFDESSPRWSKSRQCLTGKGLYKVRNLEEAPVMGAYTSALWGGGEQSLFPGEGEALTVRKWYSYGY